MTSTQQMLYGLAMGERNGGPIRMALRLGDSLVACNGFDADDVFARYHDWWRNGAFDTGNVFMHVMALADRGYGPAEAAQLADQKLAGRTAGVNPAHRIAPLAACMAITDTALAGVARQETALTHQHPLATDSAAFMAVMLRALLKGAGIDEARARASSEVSDALRAHLDRPGPLRVERGFAPDILANALCFIDQAADADAALTSALAHAGPANYGPVLVGALAGAAFGDISRTDVLAVQGEALTRALDQLADRLGGWAKRR